MKMPVREITGHLHNLRLARYTTNYGSNVKFGIRKMLVNRSEFWLVQKIVFRKLIESYCAYFACLDSLNFAG